MIVNCINDRFDQPGYKIYQNVQNLLLQVVNSEEYESSLSFVTDFYASDFDAHQLKTQLHVLSSTFSNAENASIQLPDIIKYFKTKSPAELALFSEIGTLLKLLLVMPATNAVSERSFSALRRIKSYLRSTMTQDRLNHLMTLHIHRDLTDDLDLKSCANAFVDKDEHRLAIFGRFTDDNC